MLDKTIKRTLSILLLFATVFSLIIFPVSCSTNDNANDKGEATGNGNSGEESKDENEGWKDKIVLPQYKEYERLTVDFSDIIYKRPDYDSILSAFKSLIDVIETNEKSYDEQLQGIKDLEDEYNEVRTMYAFANIYNSKDSSVTYWNDEFSYVSKNYPSFAEVIEDMFVAAANSPHAESFEKDYFGEGLIEEYKGGGIFTDEMIALWAEEEELEAEYSSISTATVKVTYLEKTDTVDNMINYYRERYGESSTDYLRAHAFIMEEYTAKTNELSTEILIKLLKTRKLIAAELGEKSYISYAYDSMGRDYSPEDMADFLVDVAEYVIPVFATLDYYVFYSYFQNNKPTSQSLDKLINKGNEILRNIDPDFADIFGYMLQFGLYDIDTYKENRSEGAFTTYLDSYEAPFMFMTASGTTEDFCTMFHEFGHFTESFINNGASSSLDKQEVSSQGLEFLMLHYIDDEISEADKKYLTYHQLSSALNVLAYQGLYAKFEELAYAIPYEEISKATLDKAVKDAAEFFGFNTNVINRVEMVFIPHIFLYPFYVQSYCTSVIPALQLYFLENKTKGAGLDAYKIMIDSTEGELDFMDALSAAGLSSPFEKDILRNIADNIYFEIVGSHFYQEKDDQNAA